MSLDLTGKVAIVTGGGHGAGAAVALALGRAGAKVCISDLNPDRAQRIENEIKANGGDAISVPADIGNKFQCVTVIETTRATWGQLDILINGMMVSPSNTIIKMDEWDFQRVFEVNLKGTFFMTQLCGRVMSDENGERGGMIINLGTTAGILHPQPKQAAVCAMNGAIVGFAAEAAQEYGEFHVRVNTVLLATDGPDPNAAADCVMGLFAPESESISGALFGPDGRRLSWQTTS